MKTEAQEVQLKVSLRGARPPIWRRIIVNSNISFYELHFTIQMSMGWGNYHLFEFKVEDHTIGKTDEDFADFGPNDQIDARDFSLNKVLLKDLKKFQYIYDFGDFWIHDIIVEKVVPLDAGNNCPICTGGRMNCPPEDCGGMPGFLHLKEVLQNKKDPEHDQMKEWLGGYDPTEFDKEDVNEYLENIEEVMEDEANDTFNYECKNNQ